MTKKKILMMSDDLRMHSGVAIMSKEIVLNSLKKYDWVQLGGAIKHPEEGKIIDMDEAVRVETGVTDACLKIYPTADYGNPDLLRQIMDAEKPDAILHYTDPRFWNWLYQMEHEVRQMIPIFYYNIWDDLPYPRWNENFYETVGLKLPDETLLFDKEMIGIHSSAFKRNVRSIYRILKKNKLRFKSGIIPRVMAQSVFYYISENIFSETLDVKDKSKKCDG